MSKAAEDQVGVVTQSRNYFSESVEEFKKVARPTPAEARQATLVTIVLVVFVALTISLFDFVFTQLMQAVIY